MDCFFLLSRCRFRRITSNIKSVRVNLLSSATNLRACFSFVADYHFRTPQSKPSRLEYTAITRPDELSRSITTL